MTAPPASRTSPASLLPTGPTSPAATRARRAGWRDPRLAIGILLVAGCGLLGARVVGSADDTLPVWAVRGDRGGLVAGQRLTAEDLATTRVRFGDAGDADRYLSAHDPLPEDAVLTRALGAGELVPRAALGSGDHTGLVELPLAVTSDVVPVTLRVGARVDVWVTGQDTAEARQVLADVPVLALPGESGSLGPAPTRQVVVGLDAAAQRELGPALAALAGGTVVLTRRAGS